MGVSDVIKEILVILIISSILLPLGMTFYLDANATQWGATEQLIWGYLPTICFVVIILAVLGLVYSRTVAEVSAVIKEILVVLIISSILLPLGMTFYLEVDTELWGDTEALIWGYLPTICFVVIILAVLGLVYSRTVAYLRIRKELPKKIAPVC